MITVNAKHPLYCYRFYKNEGVVRRFTVTQCVSDYQHNRYQVSGDLIGINPTNYGVYVYVDKLDIVSSYSRDYAIIYSFNSELNAELIFKAWCYEKILEHQKELYKWNRILARLDGKLGDKK